MFEKVLQDLGISQGGVKRAIRNLIDDNPSLKAELREIVGDGNSFVEAGTVLGQAIYTRRN